MAEATPTALRQRVSRTSDSPIPPWHTTQLLADRYRSPIQLASFVVPNGTPSASGYFRFGPDAVCYGSSSSGVTRKWSADALQDAQPQVNPGEPAVHLPFDPVQIIDNLRCERYLASAAGGTPLPDNPIFRNLYYLIRPLLPVPVRKHLQKLYFHGRSAIPFPMWPVDVTVERLFERLLMLSMKAARLARIPFIWFWPEGMRSCTIITHDVETGDGMKFCPQLMDLNDTYGVKTSFQIVPEARHPVSASLLQSIRERGFELNVHDLNHDGHLFSNRKQFLQRAKRINQYAREYGALGFRSAVMYRNVDWYDALDVSYDMSIPNVAHLDPQQGGCCTVFPFFIGKTLEIPVTATQDYTLFHIMDDYTIRLWQHQIALIREQYGLISFIIHPDYIIDERAREVYVELLRCVTGLRAGGRTWIALPREVDRWWRERSAMSVVPAGDSWRIEGKGSERARLAYAVLHEDTLTYELDGAPVSSAA